MENHSVKKSSSLKQEMTSSHYEVDGHDRYLQKQSKMLRVVDAARLSITLASLVCGIVILGLSTDAISAYNSTRISEVGWLAIWPASFDLRPTVALVVGSCLVTVANIAGLLCSKVPQIRNNTPLHTPVMFAAPFIGFLSALIAIVFFYAANASTTTDTLLSWTCRWKAVQMTSAPYFGTLCNASWAAVYLSVILVPLEAAALCVAGWQLKAEKHIVGYAQARKGGSQSPGA